MPKIGRNDPCSCGSGKKYKKCCLPKAEPATLPVVRMAESGRVPYATDEFIRNDPDSPVARMERLAREADKEALEGRPERAYEILTQALPMAPDDGMARNVLQDLEELCLNHQALRSRGPELSRELETLNLKMGDRLQAAQCAAERADFLEALGRGAEASREYSRALKEYPESTWLRLRHARFLGDRGEKERARAAYKEVLSMPDEEHAHEEAEYELRDLESEGSHP